MILCADIGGSFIDFAVASPDGHLTHRQAAPTPVADLDSFVGILADLCAPWPGVPLHIAIAGVENPATGVVHAANIPCLATTDLSRLLSVKTGRTVLIANDADCFALAEARFGVARGHSNVFGIILGTGVGGGHVIDGRIVQGLGGVTGEWGHGPFIIPPPRVPAGMDLSAVIPSFRCGCGQTGCLDTIAGARALERLHVWAGGAPADSRAILSAWERKDAQASRTMDFYLGYLSSALALVINVTGCTVIPVGGGLGNSAALVRAVDLAVRERILVKEPGVLVKQAVLARDAGLLGAACLVAVHDKGAER
ncbi:ROK family protein [Acetobacter sp. LMG 1636]|uniref:ROK family protein n=2 Tax=Acetobacter fallax TaxID=1737473 RepID=A0ABX0KBU7_9PROT|nr:ROK family protein [Acetobacter fallax]NHO33177.1 ROK family protein [Acetobacter fallax]NHO36802.1 ROK family protein [Acetobacter fallax]